MLASLSLWLSMFDIHTDRFHRVVKYTVQKMKWYFLNSYYSYMMPLYIVLHRKNAVEGFVGHILTVLCKAMITVL
jgi:hypothetical protein